MLLLSLLFWLLFLGWCASELLGPARWQSRKKEERRDRGSSVFLAIVAGIGAVLFFAFPVLLPATTIRGVGSLILFFIGVLLVVLGGALRWYAIRTLGTHFMGSVVIRHDQSVVHTGPYRLIRHPSYSGILLIVLGFGLMESDWASLLAITLGMLVGLLYRMKVEEEEMCYFPEYVAYMQRTKKRLIPYVY